MKISEVKTAFKLKYLKMLAHPSSLLAAAVAGSIQIERKGRSLPPKYCPQKHIYTVKNVTDLPGPSQDVTNQTLSGRE
jgi:hypothetical protein